MITHCILKVVIYFYSITAEDAGVYKPTTNKPHLDIDKDSAIGFSELTGGKSTTLSEVSLLILPMTL